MPLLHKLVSSKFQQKRNKIWWGHWKKLWFLLFVVSYKYDMKIYLPFQIGWLSGRNLEDSGRKLIIIQILAKNRLSCKILPKSGNLADSVRTMCCLAEPVGIRGNLTGDGEIVSCKILFSALFKQRFHFKTAPKWKIDTNLIKYHLYTIKAKYSILNHFTKAFVGNNNSSYSNLFQGTGFNPFSTQLPPSFNRKEGKSRRMSNI